MRGCRVHVQNLPLFCMPGWVFGFGILMVCWGSAFSSICWVVLRIYIRPHLYVAADHIFTLESSDVVGEGGRGGWSAGGVTFGEDSHSRLFVLFSIDREVALGVANTINPRFCGIPRHKEQEIDSSGEQTWGNTNWMEEGSRYHRFWAIGQIKTWLCEVRAPQGQRVCTALDKNESPEENHHGQRTDGCDDRFRCFSEVQQIWRQRSWGPESRGDMVEKKNS